LLWHNYIEPEKKLDCPVVVFSSPEGNRSFITGDIYDNRLGHNIHSFFTAICEVNLK